MEAKIILARGRPPGSREHADLPKWIREKLTKGDPIVRISKMPHVDFGNLSPTELKMGNPKLIPNAGEGRRPTARNHTDGFLVGAVGVVMGGGPGRLDAA